MTKSDFAKWLADFSRRFPDIGAWMRERRETMEVWFNDCFASLELTDCIAVNMQLMTNGLLKEQWTRERLPAIYLKHCSEIRYERMRRVDEKRLAQECKARSSVRAGQNVEDHRSMNECIREAEKLPKNKRRAFINQFFDSSTPVKTAEAWEP